MTNQKRVSQDTFDETVKENMDDFDMSREDAIADAIEQFKMQVSLSHIAAHRNLSCFAGRWAGISGPSYTYSCDGIPLQRLYCCKLCWHAS